MRTLHLESLRLLKALCQTHNLASAAILAEMPVSTASRLLSAMRERFEDELFTRCSGGLAPTARMCRLLPKVNTLLADYDDLMEPESFSPATLRRCFRIGCLDRAVRFVGPMLDTLARTAPGVSIEIVTLDNRWEEHLRSGVLDLVISPVRKVGEGFCHAVLASLGTCFVVAPDHPLLARLEQNGTVTLDDLLEFGHIEVAYTPSVFYRSHAALEPERWRERRIVVTVPSFFSALLMVRTSHLVLRMTASPVSFYDTLGVLRTFEAPAELDEAFEPKLIWHERGAGDPALEWFRAALIANAGKA